MAQSLGLKIARPLTQGSLADSATLGWRTQSLWDCRFENAPKAEGRRQAEIRRPKVEGRKKAEIRRSKAETNPNRARLRASVFGFRPSGFGLWTLDLGPWTLDLGLWASDFGLRTSDFGLRTLDFGLRTLDFGLRTSDFGLWASGFGLWTLDFGLLSLLGLQSYSSSDLINTPLQRGVARVRDGRKQFQRFRGLRGRNGPVDDPLNRRPGGAPSLGGAMRAPLASGMKPLKRFQCRPRRLPPR